MVSTQIHTFTVLRKQRIIQFQPCIIGVVEFQDLLAAGLENGFEKNLGF